MTELNVQMTDDLQFSRIIAGVMRVKTWQLTSAELADWVRACIDMGVTTFDNADIYGSYEQEAVFGAALELDKSLRQKMQLVTKCGIQVVSERRPDTYRHHYNTTKDHIIWSAENSLRMLRADVIDVLLIHRPDPLMDADEIAAALEILHQAGKVRYFGVSNFSPSQFDLLQSRLDVPLVTNQLEFSVVHMDPLTDGSFDQCQQKRIKPMIWGPLAAGHLFRGESEQARRVMAKLNEIGEKYNGAGADQIALAWTLLHPVKALPVIGTGKLERVKAAVDALDIQLTRQEWFDLWEASTGHDIP